MNGLLGLSLLAFAAPTVHAQSDPLAGRDRYPEFRNLSGLAGGGYGVEADGRPSLQGPIALSTPVAPTLGHSRFVVTGEKTSLHSSPEISNGWTNGTLCVTYGHTFGRVNAALTDMVLSGFGNQAFNIQAQYIPDPGSRWVWSAGAQDFIRGGGGSAGTDVPGDERTSRSVFVVGTYRAEGAAAPFYFSGGVGTRRFSRGFFSVSHQVARMWRVFIEHDGFGPNLGAMLTVPFHFRGEESQLGIRVGLVQRRYPTLGATLVF